LRWRSSRDYALVSLGRDPFEDYALVSLGRDPFEDYALVSLGRDPFSGTLQSLNKPFGYIYFSSVPSESKLSSEHR
jgi:hypothetical protein